ncbi:hypothetical protein PK28_17055 (plasmid) [Hymenobacter sp. DG25B]|uniref:DUF262 domain-containing protein n=1 Tax=Hymenobacter sp. DG25B TaxID=1385664 RepID=UPI0005410CC7|nr:DUF262 domain-containing protein [Hymenobacter sp. DG25B]AIZ65382.1 hypothetical protein PK28_17055 [Hymenobacter sp. DG25B]
MSDLNLTCTLQELLVQRNTRFRIPSYQRAYAWDQKNWTVFVEDLLEQATSVHAERKSYYLGHFLLEEEREGRVGLIDGQQRLTTAMLFCAAAISMLPRDEHPTSWYQTVRAFLKRGESPRLEVVDYDHQVFNSLLERAIRQERRVIDGRATNAQGRMVKAVEFFREWLKEQQDPQQLERLLKSLLGAQITTYAVKDPMQAAQLFELQNDRGKQLTEVEKLKSYFIYQLYLQLAPEEVPEAVNGVHKCFEHIYKCALNIKSLSEDDVLRYFHYSLYGGYNIDNVMPSIRGQVKEKRFDSSDIISFSEQLSAAFDFVVQYQAAGVRYSSISNLLMLRSYAVVYPLLLRGYFKLRGIASTDTEMWQQLNQLSGLLEKLAFRLELISSRARITDRWRLDALLNRFEGDLQELEVALRNALNEWWYWRKEEFEEYLAGLSYGHPLCTYVLWQYELSLQHRGYAVAAAAVSDVNLNELEHIAPQSENKARNAGYGRYTEVKFTEAHRNLLGNLTLITRNHNAIIGKGPFSVKLKSYDETPLAQHKEIVKTFQKVDNPRWDVAAILARQERLITWAKKRWSFSEN